MEESRIVIGVDKLRMEDFEKPDIFLMKEPTVLLAEKINEIIDYLNTRLTP